MPRMTLQVRLVLEMLLVDPGQERYGLEIVDATGLPPGTIYPILARLEQSGWLTSRWETADPHASGRPRRRYYQITADGVTEAGAALARSAAGRGRRTSPPVSRVAPGGAY